MKNLLPASHGLTATVLNSKLIHRRQNEISLTDAQFEALGAGVALGKSILLVSPTSTGKTEVGLIGIAAWLERPDSTTKRAVYLVSHRALARQKFNELNTHEFLDIFSLDRSELAMSNGDLSIDGHGTTLEDPLSARLLIATYEKFLALLASSGLMQDMSHYCIVADEFQLIADSTRGQDVEILFTAIKQTQLGQFIGLSAVLNSSDVTVLSDWLCADPVIVLNRETPLLYELCLPSATHIWTTDGPDRPAEKAARLNQDPISILSELEENHARNFPAAVFCMTKARVEKLAKSWSALRRSAGDTDRLPSHMFDEPTAMSDALAVYMPRGFAMHTADLIESERALVERALDNDELPVIFATTTLAQGLNYSFKTVIFDKWARYNFARRQSEPINPNEFHNIAGRAGRLGRMEGENHGRVIYFATTPTERRAAARYLSAGLEKSITGRLDSKRFDQIALQLLAAGIVKSRNECLRLLQESLSGHIARDIVLGQDELWEQRLDEALEKLVKWGMLT